MALWPDIHQAIHFQDCSAPVAVLASLGLPSLFVLLLNVVSRKDRDHPETVFRRMFIAMVVMPIVSTGCLWALSSSTANRQAMPLLEWLGFRSSHILPAIAIPVLLVTVGFSGEYLHRILDRDILRDVDILNFYGFRNIVAAPLAEEFVFRACMLPLLIPHFSPAACIFLSPAIFGIAHLHLTWTDYWKGEPLRRLLLEAALRVGYTTLFGSFSAFLFLRTGHFLSCFVSHAYCNLLGLPNFAEIPAHRHRIALAAGHLLSMFAFFYFLGPATRPEFTDSQFAGFFIE